MAGVEVLVGRRNCPVLSLPSHGIYPGSVWEVEFLGSIHSLSKGYTLILLLCRLPGPEVLKSLQCVYVFGTTGQRYQGLPAASKPCSQAGIIRSPLSVSVFT